MVRILLECIFVFYIFLLVISGNKLHYCHELYCNLRTQYNYECDVTINETFTQSQTHHVSEVSELKTTETEQDYQRQNEIIIDRTRLSETERDYQRQNEIMRDRTRLCEIYMYD